MVHRDLACRNIYLSHEKTCKISEYGLQRDIYSENVFRKTTGVGCTFMLILSCLMLKNGQKKSCRVNIAKFLKYVLPFFNIMYERVKIFCREPAMGFCSNQ